MKKFEKKFSGGDLRSIGKSNFVARSIGNQREFEQLFRCLFHEDRIVVMRAADAIEKVTVLNPSYLAKYKTEILQLCTTAVNKELIWHLALLVPRLRLNEVELKKVWLQLTRWAMDKASSRIVRVNSLQGLFELTSVENQLIPDLNLILSKVESENIPSLNARIRIIRKKIGQRVK